MGSANVCVAPRSYWRGFARLYVGLIGNIHYFFVSYSYEKNKYKILKSTLNIHIQFINKTFSKRFNENLS